MGGCDAAWVLVVSRCGLLEYELCSRHGSVLTSPYGVSSLKNHGADEEVHEMFEMGAETMDLPFEEKMKYEQGDSGLSAG